MRSKLAIMAGAFTVAGVGLLLKLGLHHAERGEGYNGQMASAVSSTAHYETSHLRRGEGEPSWRQRSSTFGIMPVPKFLPAVERVQNLADARSSLEPKAAALKEALATLRHKGIDLTDEEAQQYVSLLAAIPEPKGKHR